MTRQKKRRVNLRMTPKAWQELVTIAERASKTVIPTLFYRIQNRITVSDLIAYALHVTYNIDPEILFSGYNLDTDIQQIRLAIDTATVDTIKDKIRAKKKNFVEKSFA